MPELKSNFNSLISISGTAYINAVFYGRKANDSDKDKDGPSSSSSGCAVPTTTRKHILQVSTYQVSELKSNLTKESSITQTVSFIS